MDNFELIPLPNYAATRLANMTEQRMEASRYAAKYLIPYGAKKTTNMDEYDHYISKFIDNIIVILKNNGSPKIASRIESAFGKYRRHAFKGGSWENFMKLYREIINEYNEQNPMQCSIQGCPKEAKYTCGSCKNTQYCSLKCQKQDWITKHKNECK